MSDSSRASGRSRRSSVNAAGVSHATGETRASRRRNATAAKPPKRKRRWIKRILLTLVFLGVLGIAGVLAAYALIQPPKPNDIATAQASIIYYADGETELARISEINRESVPLSDIPEPVQKAMLAAEDRNFYTENGVSPSGIARSVWTAVSGGSVQGSGSTITQQYVKNYFLTADRTLTRKAKEILISVKIDQQQTKSQILENYFNTIYYGRGAYGIQTAAQAYYGKDAKDLTVSEGAFLASVVNGPSLYDPDIGEKQLANAQERWAYVLDGMVTEGWLSAADRAQQTFTMPLPYTPKTATGTSGYVSELVKAELKSTLKLTDTDIDRQGLRIVSTIDQAKEQAAIEAVEAGLPEITEGPQLHAGLASIVPGDGAIVAIYGGHDYAQRQFNNATDALLQAGSTFKIFTLIAALESGDVNIRTIYDGNSPQYFTEFRDSQAPTQAGRDGEVQNYGNTPEGFLDVPGATAMSTNTIYAQLNIAATPARTAKAAQDAGVTTEVDTNMANVFGTDTVHVMDMASAYATIAAEGLHAKPYIVASVTSADGALDYTAEPSTTQVFDKDVMKDVITCMQAVVEQGTGTTAQRIGRPAAGKTGTTTDNYAAWFDGFVPQLATAVGIYRGDGKLVAENQMDNIPGVGELTGATVPVSIWTDYMAKAVDGLDIVPFPEPAYVNEGAYVPPPVTESPSPSASPSVTPTPSSSATPSPSPTPTQSATPTPTPSPSATIPSPSPSTPSPSASVPQTPPAAAGGG